MNRFGKLLNFELKRFVKIYFVLIGITIASQIIGVIAISRGYLKMANEEIYEQGISMAEFIEWNGMMSMVKVIGSMWFMGPIALCVAALIFYIFLIWYRDWFGKNTFIYRLLMLPTARLNVFLAKATSIMMMVIGLVSIQLLLLPVESRILKMIVPKDFRVDLPATEIISHSDYLQILIPQSFIEFILYYGVGFMAVVILFTAILFERSYRVKGIVLGVLYGSLAVILFFSPLFVNESIAVNFFYPLEVLLLEIVMGFIIIIGSILLSKFLLKSRVTV